MGDVATAFVVVFLAELGDKTQLVALTLAAATPPLKVLVVLGVAIAMLQTLSVTVGALVSEACPTGRSRSGPACCSSGSRCGRGARPTTTEDEVGQRAGSRRADRRGGGVLPRRAG